MNHVNQVELVGNLGNDPKVLKETETGTFVGFQIATNQLITDTDGGVRVFINWHNICANGPHGKFIAANYKKGNTVSLRGELRNEKYTTKDKQVCYRTAVYVKDSRLVSSKQSVNESACAETAAVPTVAAANNSSPVAPVANAVG